jgi:hypothetical protein
VKKLLLTTILAALPIVAHATPITTCSLTDLSLVIGTTTYNPSQCANNVLTSGNPTSQTGEINTALGTSFALAADDSNPGDSYTLNGIKFSVTAATGSTSGNWTLAWQDVNGTAPLNLPITLDFDVGLFGGSNGDAYEFTNVTLPASPTSGTGTFTIAFANSGGQNPGLSHLILDAGDMADPPPTNAPEPASLTLFGVGLAALGFVTWRRVKG